VSTTMATTCPVQGCGYEGSPSSVEAHISGSTDDRHEGQLGRDHRHALEPAKPTTTTTDELVVGDGVAEVGEDGREGTTTDAATDDEASPAGGIPIPVSPATLTAVLVLVAAGALFFTLRSSTTASAETGSEDQSRRRSAGGGLNAGGA